MLCKLMFLSGGLAACLLADEGMWLLDHFPKDRVQKKFGFDVTDAFLNHLQLASARFNVGGSGSFVSTHGLLFTNHHVGADCIQKLSSAEHDYMADGFYAATQPDEKMCPDLEINVLLKTEDITAKVNDGIPADASSADANRRRKASEARIEKECAAATGNRCDVVSLYSGGRYGLYQYKKYTDVRLVFAPEYQIAAFGGDPDNFTYPRYCLDFSLFRAYENGKPIESPEYFRWSHAGVKDGELTFVPGNPGSTGRLQTVAQLEFSRDIAYPFVLASLKDKIDHLIAFGAKSEDNRREAQDYLDTYQNSYKAITGFEQGLRDPGLMNRKRDEERKVRGAVDRNLELQKKYGKVWDEVAAAYREYARIYKQYYLFEAAPDAELFVTARRVLRYSEERAKPNDQRLRAYQDANLPSFEQQLYSPAPISDAVEKIILGAYLRLLEKGLGADDPTVKAALDGRTPEQAADHYVSTSKLKDVAERKRLAQNAEAANTSQDGMLALARILDPPARKYRKEFEDQVEGVLAASGGKIAQARFAVFGTDEYPDATFTMRMAYGAVGGYKDAAGKAIPWTTTLGGLYKRATGKPPYDLPPSWIKGKSALDLNTPLNFVTTADTHGGNSGSPTVNIKGEIIGILFDGNIEGLQNRYFYTEEQARSVHVASNAVIESLRKIYRTERILNELGFGEKGAAAGGGTSVR